MYLRQFLVCLSLLFAFVSVAWFVFIEALNSDLPWTNEPGYRNPRYDLDSILPDRHKLALPRKDELTGFYIPPGQVPTCTRYGALHARENCQLCVRVVRRFGTVQAVRIHVTLQ